MCSSDLQGGEDGVVGSSSGGRNPRHGAAARARGNTFGHGEENERRGGSASSRLDSSGQEGEESKGKRLPHSALLDDD